MRIAPTVKHIALGLSYQANTKARAFGRKVEKAQVKSRFAMLRPVLKLCKRLTNWIISHTHNISPSLTTTRLSHPLDKVLNKNPVSLPRKSFRQLTKKLSHPEKGLDFNEAHIARPFMNDVFRQHVRLHVQDDAGNRHKTFNSKQYFQERAESGSIDDLKEQAGDALAGFAGNNPPLVRSLSSIANQATQALALKALTKLVNDKLPGEEELGFGGNSFSSCDITHRPDGLTQVDQNFDFQAMFYQTRDGNMHHLKGAAAHIRVQFLVNAEGKVVQVKPAFHVNWPGFAQSLGDKV